MGMFRVFFSSHAERVFAAIAREEQLRIVGELGRLAQNSTWHRRVKKLRGSENRYRLRAGRWRILFTLRANEIEVADIFLKKGKSDYRRRIK